MASLIGKSISHYKNLEKLGEGSMGEVHMADDRDLASTVGPALVLL